MARKSNNSFGGIIAVVAVAGLATLGWVMSRPPKTMTLDPATLANVTAAGILKGDPNAPVQVLEFADFECPGCGYFAVVTEPDVIKRLVDTGEISFRFFDFPLPMHQNAIPAHNAAQCGNEQGKVWEMHDRIFAGQIEWNTQATRNPRKVFKTYASAAGLDVSKWEECYDSERMLPQILANQREGERLRVSFTPTFVIGGRVVSGAIPYDQFRAYVLEAKVAAELAKPGTGATTVRVP